MKHYDIGWRLKYRQVHGEIDGSELYFLIPYNYNNMINI